MSHPARRRLFLIPALRVLRNITGCYEGTAKYFDSIKPALECPKVMDDVRWLLKACQKKDLLKTRKKKPHPQIVATVAGNVVCKKGHVSAIDLFLELGWLTQDKLADWKTGRISYLESVVTANLNKLSRTMKEFKAWAIHSKLKASIMVYKHKNYRLRFSKSDNPNIENAYSIRYSLLKSNKNEEDIV